MSTYYKIQFLDKKNTSGVWLGRTRINYNPTFVECTENAFVIAIEKQLLKSEIVCEYLKDREYKLVQVDPTIMSERRLYSSETDWYR